MKFGHLNKNGELEFASQPLMINEQLVFTDDPAVMLQAGEKQVIDLEQPTEGNLYAGYYTMKCYETETEIIRGWQYIEYDDETKHNNYERLVNKTIREKYTSTDEYKVLREYLAHPLDEFYKHNFEIYNQFVEDTKVKCYEEVYGTK